jgi:hypothetical protein
MTEEIGPESGAVSGIQWSRGADSARPEELTAARVEEILIGSVK